MRELKLGALRGGAVESLGALPVLTLVASKARADLLEAGGQACVLKPGEHFVELKLFALEGVLAPQLALSLAGVERLIALQEVATGQWRAALVLEQRADAVSLMLAGPGRIAFAGAFVVAEEGAAAAAPTFRGAATTLARALFRKLPLSIRRSLLSSGGRARWLERTRTAAPPAAPQLPASTNACDALQVDFENRAAVARGLRHPSYTEDTPAEPPPSDVKLVAFYLPQYHAIPENDSWWGKGFTEWTNVAKAQPQFVGHHQPRLPGELGFYDLTTPGVMAAQAQLARAHGIGAFCFHYYWFSGKRLLEKPLDAFLEDRSIDIEFCLCWANESWTRRWDGRDDQILMAQDHSAEDHARVFSDLARYMDDPRYMRIEGAPVLIVYRPDIIAHAEEMTALWRQEAKRRGWPGIYLVATTAFRFDEPERLGFDALVEFPPHGLLSDPAQGLSWINTAHAGAVFDYAKVAADEARRNARASAGATVFPGVMPGWDNEARRPGAGAIYHGATPDAYGAWLGAAIARAERTLQPDRRLVFINAWNEWAEGAHLEPDRKFGRAFLAETARQLSTR
jgi:hypothetical protein